MADNRGSQAQFARWAVALRIARRSAVKSWGRSLLIMALIAVPVAGLSAAALIVQSRQATPAERLAYTLGSAGTLLQVVSAPDKTLQQDPTDVTNYTSSGGDNDSSSDRVAPSSVLPADTKILAIGATAATLSTAGGAASIPVVTGPSLDSALAGIYSLESGRAPRAANEIAVSSPALTRLGVHVGETVRMIQPTAQTLRVVGIERDLRLANSTETVFGSVEAFGDDGQGVSGFTYFLPNTSLTWSQIRQLNASGITALSRTVLSNPPPISQDLANHRASSSALTIAFIAMALAFAVLEISLLAGAAFAVGARLQQRMLATIASVGGERSMLIRVVTGSGVVLGFVAGVVGVAVGSAAGAAFMHLSDDGSATTYPGFHFPFFWDAAILVFAVSVGWFSALLPARSAAKLDVVRALRGARRPTQASARRPIVGLVLLVAGVALSIAGGSVLLAVSHLRQPSTLLEYLSFGLLGGGPVIAQIGAVLCVGLLLRVVTRVLGRSSLGARLGARDTSRNLGRSVPAVAAIMTTVFLAVFVMCVANAASIDSIRTYSWGSNLGQVRTGIQEPGGGAVASEHTAQAYVAALRRHLPVRQIALFGASRQWIGDSDSKPSAKPADALPTVAVPPALNCVSKESTANNDTRCGRYSSLNGGGGMQITVGSVAGLGVLLGHSPSAADRETLTSGGAVALLTNLVSDGEAGLEWWTPKQLSEGANDQSAKPVRRMSIPAVVDLPNHPLQYSLYMSPAGAKAIGVATDPTNIVASVTRPPSNEELDALNTDLGAISNSPGGYSVTVEQGPQGFGSTWAWALLAAVLVIALSAGATAIGLARVDGRADDLTFASLGAPPRVRRSIAFVQGLLVCGTGGVIGAALGMLPAVALSIASTHVPFSPPWLQVLLTIVGIPLVIAGGSWLLVGNRKQLGRRLQVG